jgi:adenine-specific DNA-methyltransferase
LILQELGFPKEQYNERSSLCLLALLDMRRRGAWTDVKPVMLGITPIME